MRFKDPRLKGYFFVDSSNEAFPLNWVERSVPVIFDFYGLTSSVERKDEVENTLWCLLPKRAGRYAVVVGIGKENFIATAKNRDKLLPIDELIQLFTDLLQPRRQPPMNSKKRESPYYYDQRKGRFVKKRRL